MRLRPSSAIRASGTAAAALVPDTARRHRLLRAAILTATDAGARQVDPMGLQFVSVNPSADLDIGVGTPTQLVGAATATASWVGVNLLVLSALRRLPGPHVVAALAWGGVVYALDHGLSGKLGEIIAAKAAQAAALEPAVS